MHVLLSWLQWLSSLFYIFIWDGQEVGITFGCLVFTIERHLEACAFLPRRFSYLHALIRFFPILITLYSQKINNLNEQKYFSLNISFLVIWYILRKLIQKKFVVCFFFPFFLRLFLSYVQELFSDVGDLKCNTNPLWQEWIRSFWWILCSAVVYKNTFFLGNGRSSLLQIRRCCGCCQEVQQCPAWWETSEDRDCGTYCSSSS